LAEASDIVKLAMAKGAGCSRLSIAGHTGAEDMKKQEQYIFCGLSENAAVLAHNEHALVIPRRHVSDYFDLYPDELIASNELLK
jgi:hypothetical protein